MGIAALDWTVTPTSCQPINYAVQDQLGNLAPSIFYISGTDLLVSTSDPND